MIFEKIITNCHFSKEHSLLFVKARAHCLLIMKHHFLMITLPSIYCPTLHIVNPNLAFLFAFSVFQSSKYIILCFVIELFAVLHSLPQ